MTCFGTPDMIIHVLGKGSIGKLGAGGGPVDRLRDFNVGGVLFVVFNSDEGCSYSAVASATHLGRSRGGGRSFGRALGKSAGTHVE